MKQSPEYQIYRAIALYMGYTYPGVIYRFDMAGNNLSRAAAGKNKAIQYHPAEGYPDLAIYFGGTAIFLEIKADGVRIHKKDGHPASDHINNQIKWLHRIREAGFEASFAIGFDNAQTLIDSFMSRNGWKKR